MLDAPAFAGRHDTGGVVRGSPNQASQRKSAGGSSPADAFFEACASPAYAFIAPFTASAVIGRAADAGAGPR